MEGLQLFNMKLTIILTQDKKEEGLIQIESALLLLLNEYQISYFPPFVFTIPNFAAIASGIAFL